MGFNDLKPSFNNVGLYYYKKNVAENGRILMNEILILLNGILFSIFLIIILLLFQSLTSIVILEDFSIFSIIVINLVNYLPFVGDGKLIIVNIYKLIILNRYE